MSKLNRTINRLVLLPLRLISNFGSGSKVGKDLFLNTFLSVINFNINILITHVILIVLIVWGIGCIISTLVFIVELIFHKK